MGDQFSLDVGRTNNLDTVKHNVVCLMLAQIQRLIEDGECSCGATNCGPVRYAEEGASVAVEWSQNLQKGWPPGRF